MGADRVHNLGYTYGASSSFRALKYPGPWSAGADVRTEVTGGADILLIAVTFQEPDAS